MQSGFEFSDNTRMFLFSVSKGLLRFYSLTSKAEEGTNRKVEGDESQDRADVARLVDFGADPGQIAAYLAENAPELLPRLSEVVER